MTTAALVTSAGAAFARFAKALGAAVSVQWLPPLGPSKRLDTTESASGVVSNPTADTTVDPRRLRVRAAVIDAEGFLVDMTERADGHAAALEDAVVGWAGVRA